MTIEQFEYLMGYHCAPVLYGVKPSNLITFFRKDSPELPEYLHRYRPAFQKLGIQTKMICSCSKYDLMLVYRPEFLEESLKAYERSPFLEGLGYQNEWSLTEKLRHLQYRFATEKELPHEIGAFLGYPLEDVLGFCKYKGANAKYSGYWKVYGDVESAKKQFKLYESCRDECSELLELGDSLLSILGRHHGKVLLAEAV